MLIVEKQAAEAEFHHEATGVVFYYPPPTYKEMRVMMRKNRVDAAASNPDFNPDDPLSSRYLFRDSDLDASGFGFDWLDRVTKWDGIGDTDEKALKCNAKNKADLKRSPAFAPLATSFGFHLLSEYGKQIQAQETRRKNSKAGRDGTEKSRPAKRSTAKTAEKPTSGPKKKPRVKAVPG